MSESRRRGRGRGKKHREGRKREREPEPGEKGRAPRSTQKARFTGRNLPPAHPPPAPRWRVWSCASRHPGDRRRRSVSACGRAGLRGRVGMGLCARSPRVAARACPRAAASRRRGRQRGAAPSPLGDRLANAEPGVSGRMEPGARTERGPVDAGTWPGVAQSAEGAVTDSPAPSVLWAHFHPCATPP